MTSHMESDNHVRPRDRAVSQGLRLLIKDERAEAAAWRNYQDNPSPRTRAKLFERYQPFARQLAKQEWHKLGNLGLELADCEQLAFEGLLQSIDRFDAQKGVPFNAFARLRIRGAIRNTLAKTTDATALYSAQKRIERDRLRSLRDDVKTTSDDPIEVLRELAVGIALGFMLESAEEAGLDAVPSDDPSAYEAASWQQLVSELNNRLDTLPERERAILEYHYKKDVQFSDIAKLFEVSKGRISQIHSQALKRLRASLSKFR